LAEKKKIFLFLKREGEKREGRGKKRPFYLLSTCDFFDAIAGGRREKRRREEKVGK